MADPPPENVAEGGDPSAATAPAEMPTVVQALLAGRFKLMREIGSGGMGTVYAARDTHMQGQPLIAIKLLNAEFRKNLDAVTALERECRRVRILAHENIVRVFEFYRTPEHVFITMELLEGETFDRVIARHSKGMGFETAWPLIRAAAAALAYSHKQKPPFIHYDFKPSNVFLTKEGQVKVLDFGVGRAVHAGTPNDTTSSRLYDTAMPGFLTLAYASCEMIAGLDPDPRDDIYSLSCFAYEVFSGSHPFNRAPAVIASNLGSAPLSVPNLGVPRNRALAQGLAFDREKRTPSVDQFINDLDAGETAEARATSRRRVRQRWAIAAALIVAVITAAGAAWRLTPRQSPVSPQSVGIGGARVAELYGFLGIKAPVDPAKSYPAGEVAQQVRRARRQVTLGSPPAQIDSALQICKRFAAGCSLDMYADEQARTVTLAPFQLDRLPVSVEDFGQFVTATGYQTQAERAGAAFAWVDNKLRSVPGGSWRNGVGSRDAAGDSAVVGVSLEDGRRYCEWKQQRLPTEDEWEYTARGPQSSIFPTGDDISSVLTRASERPRVSLGPPGGINNLYFGLTGNVWQWVDTSVDGKYVLKGASWLETNPANKRAAARRTEQPDRADSDSGFRCARALAEWPDAQFWLRRVE